MINILRVIKRGISVKIFVAYVAPKYKYLSFMIGFLCFAPGIRLFAQPLEIGNRRQVFIDEKFLAESKGVEFIVHQPQKTGEWTIKPEYAWEAGGIGPYSSVLKVDDTYHMWYHAMASVQWNIDKKSGAICYAQSKDGIHWEKPVLGLVEFDGNKENNIVLGHGAADVYIGQDGGMVFIDPNAPDDRKFNLPIRVEKKGETFHIFSSPDGIHWKLTYRSVLGVNTKFHLDTQNVIFWDNQANKYIIYGRGPSRSERSIFRVEADQIDRFSLIKELPLVLSPDSLDLSIGQTPVVDYYMSAAIKYPWADNAYYMFPTAYFHYIPGTLSEFREEVPKNAGPLDTQFTASTDGVNWQRYGRQPFIGLGMKGEFDWASARMFYGIVPAVNGREIYMYYRASDWLHGWDRDEKNKQLLTTAGLGASQNIAVISRIVLRMDGFVSLRGAYTGGEFTTPLLKFEGNKLFLNVNTSATGIVRVGIIDMNGNPVEGYRMEDCDRIHTANEINRVVSWGGNNDVSIFAGKAIRLRFEIRNADLFAFQFKD
ncbi:MAG TPA: hypothetical protein DD458_15825 [Prolixibacteraceae bacterium]|nr:MAG: hypothetical protein A2W89_13955 [Bacteroidetes bacterium GWE2_42_39]HBL76694.1 hypothetical protein [Prolixibacteraceae bacterium]